MNTFQTQIVTICIPSTVYREIQQDVQERYALQITATGADYVFDMKNVNNLYSPVLNLIMYLYRQVTEKQGQVCLVNVSSNVRSALRSLKIDTLMPIYETMFDLEVKHESPEVMHRAA